jgi:ABC-type glycerol-3-phosphate transport system substrate-binding protein
MREEPNKGLSRRHFLQRTAALGAAVGLTSLAGCAAPAPGGGSGDAATEEVAEVTYWKPPHGDETALWAPLLEQFQTDNPNISVEHQVIPWASVDEQFTAAFAGGDPPDVFYLPDEWYPKYVNQNQIADLTELIGDWEDQYSPAAWGIASYKGKVWGAPFLGVVQSLLMNMNLFNEKGLELPTNWEELRAVAAELTDVDAGIYGINIPASVTNWVIMVPLLATGGAQVLTDDLTQVACNTEGAVAAWEMALENIVWNDKSGIPVGFTDDQRQDLEMQGKVGITWEEQSQIKAIWRTQAPDLELDAIPLPQLTDDGQPATWANVGFMFVAQESENFDAAFSLLEFLSTKEVQEEYVIRGVDLLPLRLDAEVPEDIETDPVVEKMVSYLQYGVGTQISVRWREATNSVVQESHAVMSGQKSAAQALADVEATVNPILDGE